MMPDIPSLGYCFASSAGLKVKSKMCSLCSHLGDPVQSLVYGGIDKVLTAFLIQPVLTTREIVSKVRKKLRPPGFLHGYNVRRTPLLRLPIPLTPSSDNVPDMTALVFDLGVIAHPPSCGSLTSYEPAGCECLEPLEDM